MIILIFEHFEINLITWRIIANLNCINRLIKRKKFKKNKISERGGGIKKAMNNKWTGSEANALIPGNSNPE